MTDAVQIVREHMSKLAVEGSADAIALALEAQNIKALCGNANQCAIAVSLMNALDAKLGDKHGILVCVRVTGSVDLYPSGFGMGDVTRIPAEHAQLAEFITNFDAQKYPELIAS